MSFDFLLFAAAAFGPIISLALTAYGPAATDRVRRLFKRGGQ